MTNPLYDLEPPPRRVRSSVPWIFLAFCLVAIATVVILFLNVGRWLVVEDSLEKAGSIVVLSGRIPMRALEAARLYQAGWAPQVWLTHPEEPTASLAALDIDDPGEDALNARASATRRRLAPRHPCPDVPPSTIPPTKSARSRPKLKSNTLPS